MNDLGRMAPVLAAVCGCMAIGCVQRTISVTSNPSGALVYLNDEEVGRTPLTVSHRFYGVYDVRLEHDPIWYRPDEAATVLGISSGQLEQMVESRQILSREQEDLMHVRVAYRPLWTKREAKAPWWEAPGPDLVAEIFPDNHVHQTWTFDLVAVGAMDLEALAQRAAEMGAMLDEVESPPAASGP